MKTTPIARTLKTYTLLLLVALTGCLRSASRISAVSLGMSRDQVLKIMGSPVSVTTDTNATFLNYNLAEVPTYFDMPGTPYEIKLVDNKVVSYGRAGEAPGVRPIVVPIVTR